MRPGLLDQLQQRGDVLLKKLEKVTDDVDNLLSQEMVDQLHGTAASIQKAADGVATLTQQMAPAAGKLPATIDKLDRTLVSTNQLITSLNRPDGPFEMNLNKVGTAAQQAGDALTQMNGSLQELSARVGVTTRCPASIRSPRTCARRRARSTGPPIRSAPVRAACSSAHRRRRLGPARPALRGLATGAGK